MSHLRKTATTLVKRTQFSAATTAAFPSASEMPATVTRHANEMPTKKQEIENLIARNTQNQQQLQQQNEETKSGQTHAAARPYSEVPGPWPMPVLGNAWRFAPLIGHYKISDLDKVMKEMHINYGKIVKVGGLLGHPDLLFIFDGDEIRNIFKKEETLPHSTFWSFYTLALMPYEAMGVKLDAVTFCPSDSFQRRLKNIEIKMTADLEHYIRKISRINTTEANMYQFLVSSDPLISSQGVSDAKELHFDVRELIESVEF